MNTGKNRQSFWQINASNALIQDYLKRIEFAKLTKEQSQKCEGEVTEEELLKALKYLRISRLETTE